jgi:RNA polymerase sigma-70 factor (ECF subfamily)
MQIKSTATSDGELIVRARAGDSGAASQLIERHIRCVWSIAFARLGDSHAADDLTQEVFLVALVTLDSLANSERFAAWVSQIARTRSIDWLRARQRSSKLVGMISPQAFEHIPEPAQELAMQRDEQNQIVRNAILALPHAQREIVLLKYADGLNQAEIADRLAVHPATIGRQLEKAYVALRTVLEPLLEEGIASIRPSAQLTVTAVAIPAALAAMPGPSRAALLAAAGSGMPLTATGSAGASILTTFATGAGIMTSAKAVIVAGGVLAFCSLCGVAMYRSGTPATPLAVSVPSAVPVNAFLATPDQLQAIADARNECFPPEVGAKAKELSGQAIAMIDPERKLPSQVLTAGLDHQGTCWLAFRSTVDGDGTGRVRLGTFDPPRLMGAVASTGEAVSVEMVRSNFGNYAAMAQFDSWPAGEQRTIDLLGALAPETHTADGIREVHLHNRPDADTVQQIVLVATPGWQLKSATLPATASATVNGYTIHVWQKHLGKTETLDIRATLERADPS